MHVSDGGRRGRATRWGCFFESEWLHFSPAFAVKLPSDAIDRTDTFDATSVSITDDDRYNDGYRERPDTVVTYTCTPVMPTDE